MKNKKHKVKIPKGYILVNETKTKIDGFMTITLGLEQIKKPLPKTWDEFCKANDTAEWRLSKYKYNKEIDALRKLLELRDHYNGGWDPNYKNSSTMKYYIGYEKDEISRGQLSYTSRILAFRTKELRDLFLENFIDIIETAKLLL